MALVQYNLIIHHENSIIHFHFHIKVNPAYKIKIGIKRNFNCLKFFIFLNFQILLKSKSSLLTSPKNPNFNIYSHSTYLTPFIVLPQRNFQRRWCSSVGRAWDWRSQGRWFDPGHQHFFIFVDLNRWHRDNLKIKPYLEKLKK